MPNNSTDFLIHVSHTHSLTFFLNSASNNRNIIKIKIIPGNLQSIKQYSITKYNGIRQCYNSSLHVH